MANQEMRIQNLKREKKEITMEKEEFQEVINATIIIEKIIANLIEIKEKTSTWVAKTLTITMMDLKW